MFLLLSSAALSLLAVIAVWLAGRRDPARSPGLTLGSLLTLLALPFLALLPKFTVELPAAANNAMGATVSAFSWLAMVWLLGCGFFALRLVADFKALNRWRRVAIDHDDPEIDLALEACRQRLGVGRRVRVRFQPDAVSPSIAGLFRPVIYLPPTSRRWSEETLRMVLLHELGHVARRDLLTSLAARFACLVHWYNPLVWWLRGRLMAQCEFACDAKVIEVGADPAIYAMALCDVAEASALPEAALPAAALAMAGRASLRQRVERVIHRQRQSGSLLVSAALLLTVTASLALSVVRLSPPELASSGSSGDALYTPEEIHLRMTANPFPGDK